MKGGKELEGAWGKVGEHGGTWGNVGGGIEGGMWGGYDFGMSMLQSIMSRVWRSPGRVAVVDDRQTYTYGKLALGSMVIAREIARATSNKHVGIMLPTSGVFPMSIMGVWRLGRVGVPLNYLLKPEELTYVIRDAGLDCIVTAGPLLDMLKLRDAIPDDVKLITLEDVSFKAGAVVSSLRLAKNRTANDTAVILYTSGTSGKPKGVMLSHGNIRSDVEAGIEHSGLSASDTFLGVLPQFHSFGLTALTMIPLSLGARVVYSAKFMPKRIVELLKEHRPQVMMAVPSMYGALLSVKSATREDFSSLSCPISGGEPLPDAVFEAYQSRFGVKLFEGYGLTETSPATHWCTPDKWKRHAVGQALPGVQTLIVDDKDQPLGVDEDGEVLIAGPIIMQGYYQLPEQTDAVFVEINGTRYFRTGDIGKLDSDGYLYITGRKKEMIIIGGENVFPREIEEVLNKHESVTASAVIGMQDGMRGEVPIAFVEIEEDATFDEGALRKWCRDSLANYKVPKEIRHIEALPRNPTGKIMRRELVV